MTIRFSHVRNGVVAGLLAAGLGLGSGDAQAGDHNKVPVQTFVPVYPVAAQAPLMYAAPSPVYSSTYSAPAAYQAPVTYSAPAVYSAPAAPMVYSAPAAQPVGNAPAVGNAPGSDGFRLKPVDRNDIIGELRAAAKENGTGGSTRERRRSLRETAQTKYAEAIGVETSELTPSENADIDQVVNQIIDSNGAGTAPGANGGSFAPGGYGYGYGPGYGYGYGYPAPYAQPYAAGYMPVARAAMIVQPVVPVQLFVPVQPKHHLFRK
ncbi:MAG: hypothetical protein U0794_19325 [Isosphaeraceae bacterium]